MSDLLMRDAAPFDDEVWEQIDDVVKQVAKQQLVGRRFIHLFGPLGAGAVAVPQSHLAKDGLIRVVERGLLQFEELQQDFLLAYQDITTAKEMKLPLDLSPVAQAATILSRQEDELIFTTLRKARGTQSVPLGGWGEAGGAFATVSAALEKLTAAGIYGPYALVVSTNMYAQLQRVMKGTGRLEIKHIGDLLDDKIYFSPILKGNEGFLLASSQYNLDLAVAQDMIATYIGNEGLDHAFRLMEKVVLRVKRPAAICIIK